MDTILHLLQEHHLLAHQQQGITFLTLSQPDGFRLAKEALYTVVDTQTALFLSGGRTPKEFYVMLAQDEKLIPGAVGLIDERYGEPMHETSNEKMIADSGLARYFQMRDIPYYPVLSLPYRHSGRVQNLLGEKVQHEKERSWTSPSTLSSGPKGQDDKRLNTAFLYDQTLRKLFSSYRHSVGILGIGLDGHTAGIPANPTVWEEFEIAKRSKTEYVIDYDDHGKFYHERITMTFLALSMLDVIIVLCFGNDKKPALEKMLSDGPEEEIPSRFYKRPEIAKKTLIITDQSV